MEKVLLPKNIDMDFHLMLTRAGWSENRVPLIGSLPAGLEDHPDHIVKFVKALWWINVSKVFHMLSDEGVISNFSLWEFGEQTRSLENLSMVDSYNHYYIEDTKINLRSFGTSYGNNGNEVCIDEKGRVYLIGDDLYFSGGCFYEGLYNLIYSKGKSFYVYDEGELMERCPSTNKRVPSGLNIHSDF